jgi:hypothetical protein
MALTPSGPGDLLTWFWGRPAGLSDRSDNKAENAECSRIVPAGAFDLLFITKNQQIFV